MRVTIGVNVQETKGSSFGFLVLQGVDTRAQAQLTRTKLDRHKSLHYFAGDCFGEHPIPWRRNHQPASNRAFHSRLQSTTQA